MHLFVQSKDETITDYIANIKVTSAANSINNILASTDFDSHATQALAVATIGNVSLNLKVDDVTVTDFKSLTESQIENVFILFELGS
jgi:hypothetical protein